MPLSYLTHSAHWRDMVLAVGPGALIPRPETELMVDLAVAAVEGRPELGLGHWLDLGTGSGALAVGLASALPDTVQVSEIQIQIQFSFIFKFRSAASNPKSAGQLAPLILGQ